MLETMVEVRNLTKNYTRPDGTEVQAVKSLNFDIYKGEIFSLLGPNGAGKTTTISMISGLLEPTDGDAKIGGYSITKQALQAKRLLGVVPQEVALYPSLTARQNLEFFGKMYGLRRAELKERVDEVLEFIDLVDRQADRVESYSGGMKRRVNIGVGLLHKPSLLYMDEPTVGIDPQNRRRILDTVKRLRDEFDVTVIYTTHLMEEAQELSDRVGIIDYGELIALGEQGDLIQQVGEEDRLIFQVGDQVVSPDVLERMTAEIPDLTEATFDPIGIGGEDPGNISGLITVSAMRGRKALPDLIELANDAGIEIHSVQVHEPDLEAVFLNLTGRALRD